MTSQPVQTVSYYEMIGIQAARKASRCGGGFRVWTLAKAIDTNGTGKVKREDLRAEVIAQSGSARNWQRWIIEARNADMITDYQDRAGEWWLILASPARVALSMGLEAVGRKATIPAADLFGAGWKARVYAAFEHGKQISREQIQKAANVPVRTQTYRAAQVGGTRTRNYSKSTFKAGHITGLRENSKHKAPFVMRDGFIAWRLPDMRTLDHIERVSKGRGRKINSTIRNLSQKGLSNMRRAFTAGTRTEFVRLFNLTEAQLKQSVKRIAKQDRRVNDLYQRAETTKNGAQMWQHCPMGGTK